MANENSGKVPDNNEPYGSIANTGNTSNPPPQNDDLGTPAEAQLLNEKAEKYLREGGNIEDVPDAQDQQQMDEALKEESE